MLNEFDSIFNFWDQTIYDYDSRYHFIKQKHKKYRRNIINNFKILNDYLQVTELACYYYNDTINIAADAYVGIEVFINGDLFSTISPRSFSLKDNKIITSIIDSKLPYSDDIQSIVFRNSITKDTIQGDRLILINL